MSEQEHMTTPDKLTNQTSVLLDIKTEKYDPMMNMNAEARPDLKSCLLPCILIQREKPM